MASSTVSILDLPVELIEMISAELGHHGDSTLLALRSSCRELESKTRTIVNERRFAWATRVMGLQARVMKPHKRESPMIVLGNFRASKFSQLVVTVWPIYCRKMVETFGRASSKRITRKNREQVWEPANEPWRQQVAPQVLHYALEHGQQLIDTVGYDSSLKEPEVILPEVTLGPKTLCDDMMFVCLNVLLKSALPVENLKLGYSKLAFPSSLIGSLSHLNMFKKLRTLHLQLASPKENMTQGLAWPRRGYGDMQVLGDTILQADDLTDLSLVFDDELKFTPDRFIFNHIMARTGADKLLRLRKIALYNHIVDREQFLKFVSKRKKKLDDVFLHRVQSGLDNVWLETHRYLQALGVNSIVLLDTWNGSGWAERYSQCLGLGRGKQDLLQRFGSGSAFASLRDPETFLRDPVYVREFLISDP